MQNLLSSSLLSKNLKINLYRTISFPVVWYGRETWSFTLREEHRLRVFEKRVLGRIFGPMRDEVTEDWRKFRNEELNDLYSSSNIFRISKSRRVKWVRHVARMGDRKGIYRVMVGNLRKRGHLEDPGVDGRIILRWIFRKCVGGMNWVDMAQDRDRWGHL